MTFSKVTIVYNHHHYLVPEHFHHLKVNPVAIKQLLLIPPNPQLLATTNLFPVPIDLPFLSIS